MGAGRRRAGSARATPCSASTAAIGAARAVAAADPYALACDLETVPWLSSGVGPIAPAAVRFLRHEGARSRLCGNQIYGARLNRRDEPTPSTRHLLDGVPMSVRRR